MTVYQMEAFLTLASTLNFTKASAIIHTTQPNLSKIVMNIEQEVGVPLINRNKRDVKLTPAGEAFARELQKCVEQYQCALTKAREVDAGILGSIDVGFIGTALVDLLPQVVRRFRVAHPDILLHLYDYTYSRLMEDLAEDRVDIALIPDRELGRIPKLNRKFLFSDDMCLVVGRDHPCAGLESIDLQTLQAEPFVVMDPAISIRDYELVMDICTEQDFAPQIAYEANTLNNLLLMVECGVGVSILAQHMTHFATKHVRFVKIKGYEDFFRVSAAWQEDANPCIPHLVAVIDDYLQGRETR